MTTDRQLPSQQMVGDHHELLMRLQAVQHATDRPYAASVAKDAGDAIKALLANRPHQEHVVGAARAFMELFVVDNGEDRGLSIDDIDMTELTHRYAALEAALNGISEPQAHMGGGDELSLTKTGLKIAMTKIAAYEARIAELEAASQPPSPQTTGTDDEHLWRFWNEKARVQAIEIDRLRAIALDLQKHYAAATQALKPFAEAAERFDGVPVSETLPQQCWFSPHSLREARAALTTEGQP